MEQEKTYELLIKSIRKKRTILIVLTIILCMIIIFLSSPWYIMIADTVILAHQGIPSPLMIIFLLALMALEWFLALIINEPLRSSLDQECDPHKFLTLNRRLNASRMLDAANLWVCFTPVSLLSRYFIPIGSLKRKKVSTSFRHISTRPVAYFPREYA